MCKRCCDVGWVCERHPDRLGDETLPNGCECGAGGPWPDCNVPAADGFPSSRGLFATVRAAIPEVTLPRGARVEAPPQDHDTENYARCEQCGGWIDVRDIGAILDHKKPLSHRAQDKPQEATR